MQSKDYVPGVSGWKLNQETGRLQINEGNVRIKANVDMVTWAGPGQSNDQAEDSIREALDDQQVATAAPFVVEVGRFFINGGQIDDATIKSKIATDFTVRLATTGNGQNYVAGTGLADAVDFDKAIAEGDAGKILDLLVGTISETSLAKDLTDPIRERIRQVIREELRPGGLLHRFNR